jgi:hypothetical protein
VILGLYMHEGVWRLYHKAHKHIATGRSLGLTNYSIYLHYS